MWRSVEKQRCRTREELVAFGPMFRREQWRHEYAALLSLGIVRVEELRIS